MKTRLLKTMLVLTLALIALPMMGQDFMNVYFKDGTFRKFYMKNVIEITTSKFDKEGVKHGDYDYQHVTTIHDKYVYSLEDVDSITFTKIDEEKAEQNFVSAMSSIFPTVDECETIDEVESKIDQIKSAEGVADAWSDGHQLFISIIEGETISFHFNHDAVTDEPLEESASQVRELQLLKTSFQKPDGTPLKAVIANQQEKDEDRDYSQNFNRLIKDFQDCGIQVEYLPSPTIDFFYSNSKDPQNLHIYDFDIVLLSTHGGYSQLPYYKETWLGNPGIEWGPMAHSIITSEDFEMIESKSKEADDLKWKSAWKKYYATFRDWRDNSKYKDATDQHINFTYCKEKRDGNWYWVGHPELTEYFFKDIAEGQFTNPQSIFYNASCQSLKGDNGQPSYSFANVLFNERNLGVYIGYTETNFSGQRGGCEFLENMTLGYSVEVSRDRLPDWCKLETLENIEKNAGDFTEESLQIHRNTPPHHAEMEILYSDKTDVSNTSFLFPTISVPIDNDQAIFDFYQKNKVTLNGITSFSRKKNDVTVGFRYGVNPHTLIQDITGRKETTANITNGNYPFKAEITGLTPGYTYYYRAYTFDGQNYNYGETCLFKIDKYDDLKLSANSSFINNGESTTIDITGSGEYDIFKGNEKVTKVTLDGEKLIIEGIGAGESTIIVTDKKTGQTAPLEVTVWARLSIAIIGNIDLEVGDKTNVRIMSGNNDYTLDSDYPKVATPTLIGEFVSVEALSAGKATITVTDNKTGQTASFTVTVTDSTPVDMPAAAVDLGLPSGTLWANKNVGAASPEKGGLYFAWGEIVGYGSDANDGRLFDWDSYKWDNFTKYCSASWVAELGMGIVDNKTILDPEDDAATANWGENWRMPTYEEFRELLEYTTNDHTYMNGEGGRVYKSLTNGNSIFLPYTGYRADDFVQEGWAHYWSSTQVAEKPDLAYKLTVDAGHTQCGTDSRVRGFLVRPVFCGSGGQQPTYDNLQLSTDEPITINVNAGLTYMIISGSGTYAVESSNEAVATVTLRGNYVDVSGVAAGTATITVIDVMSGQQKTREVTVIDNTPLPGTPAEAIDLGLPSGTLWASYNLGATRPEDFGGYYAWGELEARNSFEWEAYQYYNSSDGWIHIGEDISGTNYDAARKLWGDEWRMPSSTQFRELKENCTIVETEINGIYGRKFTGKNGNSIFLPAGGSYFEKDNKYKGSYGYYRSSNLSSTNKGSAQILFFKKRGELMIADDGRANGLCVRPVTTTGAAVPDLVLESTAPLSLQTGKGKEINIVSGSGSYTAKSDDESVATADFSDWVSLATGVKGKSLNVYAVGVGTATVTVTDVQSLQQVSIKVTVTESTPADEEVTQAQYEAAKAGIEVDGTYHIYTQFNGTTEGAKKYYLKDDGHLTESEEEAYVFTFGRVEGSSLFVSPGWKLDIPFSNPHLSNGATGTLPLHGQIRVDWDNNRNDWEGQVWYKNGDYYAVRSTNAVSEEWGASTFWAVLDSDANGMPEADYSLTPKFVWQLEKAEAKENPRDLMLTTESQGTTYSIYRQVIDKKDIHTNPDKWITYRSLLTLDVTKNGATTTYTLDDNIYLEEKFGYNEGQVPCIILNYQTNEIGIFCVSKDAKAGNYTMDGYYYTSPMNSISFQREKVFDNSNWGWFPYFTYDNGQLKLQHFSYKGYYAMTSTRKSVGSWSTSQGSSIRPENFKQNSIQIGHVLIISGSTDPVNTDCPARVVSVDLNSTEYHRSSSYPNQMLFSVNAKLDDMTDVTEWGVYFDNRPGKKEFAFESVSAEQTIKLYYNGQEGLLKVDVNSYIAQLDDEVGVYVKKRDKTTGTQKTLYSNLFSFRLLYDKKPSMVISNPVIVKTVITGVSDGNNEYRTDITHDYTLTGAFWISYIDSEVSGGSWTFKNSNPTWYPEADGSGQLSWVATYDDDTDLPHTNWRVLHLRNNKTINSNYVNFNGSKVLTEAWVSDSPLYTARMAERKNSAKSSQGHISFSIPEESSRGSNIQKKQEVPYKGGYLGTY